MATRKEMASPFPTKRKSSKREPMARPEVDLRKRKTIKLLLGVTAAAATAAVPRMVDLARQELEERKEENSWPTETINKAATCYLLVENEGGDAQMVPIFDQESHMPVTLPERTPVVLDSEPGPWNEIPGYVRVTVYFKKDEDNNKYRFFSYKEVWQAMKEGKPTDRFRRSTLFLRETDVKLPNDLTYLFKKPLSQ